MMHQFIICIWFWFFHQQQSNAQSICLNWGQILWSFMLTVACVSLSLSLSDFLFYYQWQPQHFDTTEFEKKKHSLEFHSSSIFIKPVFWYCLHVLFIQCLGKRSTVLNYNHLMEKKEVRLLLLLKFSFKDHE